MQRPKQPIATAVTGEHAAGAVCSVCGWRKAEKDDPSRRVTKPWDRLSPVVLVAIRGTLFFGDEFSPLDQTRA